MALYKKDKDGNIERVKDPNMQIARGATGQPVDPDKLSDEDAQARAAKAEAKRFEPLPDESQEQYEIRMRRMQRSKMTGAQVMEYDALMLKFEKEARYTERLRIEPEPKGEIIAVRSQDNSASNLQVRVKFDSLHPLAPNTTGEITIHGSSVWQGYFEDGENKTRRLPGLPEEGMTGILRSVRDLKDGITLHWSFVADAA